MPYIHMFNKFSKLYEVLGPIFFIGTEIQEPKVLFFLKNMLSHESHSGVC